MSRPTTHDAAPSAPTEEVTAPTTMEGYYALHRVYRIDWHALGELDDDTRANLVRRTVEWLASTRELAEGSTAIYSIVGGKGDLLLFHLRPTLDDIAQAEIEFARLGLERYLEPTYSYVSVTELAMHGSMDKRHAATLEARGLEPDTEEWALAMETLQEEHEEFLEKRLKPEISLDRYLCFYPMSKRRGEHINWYRLPARERGHMMRDHANVGRKYIGKVLQLVSGSIGFDDYEWGVTLYSNDPLQFKKLIYEMRYDRASADYAEFGPFYLGIRFDFEQLPELLDGRLPTLAGI